MACFRCGNRKLVFIRSTFKISKKKESIYPTISNYRWFCEECGSHERRGSYRVNKDTIEMYRLKREAHYMIDYYWLYDHYSRYDVYQRVRKVLGLKGTQRHNIGALNREQLERLIQVVKEGNFLWYQRAL